jgi:hypothetical protein
MPRPIVAAKGALQGFSCGLGAKAAMTVLVAVF